jgi:hypothetical protein
LRFWLPIIDLIKAVLRRADRRCVLEESRGAGIASPGDPPPASVAPPSPRIVLGGCDRRGPTRRQVTWRALLIVASIVVALLSAWVELRGGGPSEAAQAAAMIGDWQAQGRVLRVHDSAIQTPGEVINRLWRIEGGCGKNGCDLQLTREIAGATVDVVGGVMTAPLVWDDGRWQATFREANVSCQAADASATLPATEDSTWTITLADDGTITALEHTTTAGSDCITGTTELQWTAHNPTNQQPPVSSQPADPE